MSEQDSEQISPNFQQMLKRLETPKGAKKMSPEYMEWILEIEEHIRAFMTNAQDFMVYRLVRNDQRPYLLDVIFASPSVVDILDASDPFNLETWFEAVHPDDLEKATAENLKAFETLKFNITARIFHKKKNEWRWVQAIGTGSNDLNGEPKYANGIIIDVTDQKRAEEALRESEEKHRDLVENINDVVFALDTQGICTYISPRVEPVLGYAPDEVIGRTLSDFIHPQNLSEMINGLKEVISGKSKTSQYRVFDHAGDIRWVRISSRPVFRDGQLSGIRGIFTDVTEHKKAEEEKIRLEDQLRQAHKLEAIGTLAGGIAHNLNNILYPIVGYTEMALEDIPGDSLASANLREVLLAADRAKELVRQVLTVSRKTEPKQEVLNVSAIVRGVLKLISATLPSFIQIKQDVSRQCGPINADPSQIHQVAMNLCTNAYHAMRDTGGILKVILDEVEIAAKDLPSGACLQPGLYVKITVSDTGHGMKQEVQDRIFEPYFTTKEIGQGTGMGLAMAHAIIHKCGGEIHVCSKPGKGTVFDVYLPVTGKRPAQARPAPQTPDLMGAEHILLVEDDPQILDMSKQMLRRLGYRVTSYFDCNKSLDAFRANPKNFDLVITDMTMPGMTGDIFAKKIMGVRSDIPIILCTGFSEKIDGKKADNMGISAFLLKPLNKSQVADTIRKVLEKRT